MTSDALPTQRRLIAQRLTFSLVRELAKNEQARLNIEADPQAYHSYLVGASLMGKLTLPHIRKARGAFKEALRYNPHFSPAFAGLARTYTSEWLVTAQGNEELLRLAETSAEKAIEGDSIFAGGHRELGVAKLYLGDVDHSVSALSLAEELSPILPTSSIAMLTRSYMRLARGTRCRRSKRRSRSTRYRPTLISGAPQGHVTFLSSMKTQSITWRQ
ncbi:hypothetical protein AJ87_36655 [Rhizobium yanglingense]|nr:hypothetical protein AJ87_36655 [Rhizobium yanglingense]